MKEIYQWIDEHQDELLAEFREFLRIPSVASKPDHDMEGCARWVQSRMAAYGFQSEISPTDGGPPVVFAQIRTSDHDKILSCYAHYDVQPVEPLEEWAADPFGAEIVDGKIIARGAQDDKSGVMAFIQAAAVFMKVRGELPVNLNFVFEGEEEVGSAHYGGWVEANRHRLTADGEASLDGAVYRGSGRPPVSPMWLAGLMTVEFRCRTTKTDFYSAEAQWGPNAAWRLVWALSTMKDQSEKITIDGWYDDYIPASQHDLEHLKSLPFDVQALKNRLGLDKLLLGRETPEELLHARHYLPTMSICGMQSGYTGSGFSTRVPSYAFAKVDFRLKAGMDPMKQLELVRAHLKKHGFDDVECVYLGSKVNRDRTPASSAIVQAMLKSSREVFGLEPVLHSWWEEVDPIPGGSYQLTGPGSMAALGTSAIAALGIPSACSAFADGASLNHAPNEFITPEAYIRGVKYAATIMAHFAEEIRS